MSVSEAPAPRLRTVSLRTEIRSRYEASGAYRPTGRQLEWMENVLRYLARVQRRDGDRILRSVPQIAKGLGLPVEGLSTRLVRDRWEDQLTNTLRYLELAGFVDHVERDLRRSNGEGIGIGIHLSAGVAQSVRAAESRRGVRVARRPACSSLSPTLPPPFGGAIGGVSDFKPFSSFKSSTAAGAQGALGTRDRALASAPVRAALDSAVRELGIEEAGGRGVLDRLPELASVPADVVAREAWRLFGRPGRPADCRLSPVGSQRFARAAYQLERTGYSGLHGGAAAAAAAIDLALGDWREHWLPNGTEPSRNPQTLGGLAVCYRRLAHLEVKRARARRRRARG